MRRLLVVAVACCVVAPAADAAPVFVVKGRGFGHGIGMSQYGAQGLAARGWAHGRILAHYYPGTTLSRAAPTRVRVLLTASRKRVAVSSSRPFRLVDARGKRQVRPAGRLVLGPRLRGLAAPLRVEPGAAPVSLDGRPYRGALVVRSNAGRIAVVNDVPLERYLGGVVPYEMPHHWRTEALRAQAVVARSYALATLKPGAKFDLRADQRSQVYGGVRAETPETNRAVGATAGRVLRWRGRIATTFYHSTSGGRTAAAWDVWPDAERVPYLRGVADPLDRISPHHAWPAVRFTAAGLAKRLRLPRPLDVRVRRNASGRAAELVVRTAKGTKLVDAAAARRELGLRSTWFSVGVLQLRPTARQVPAGKPVVLRGLARGVRAPTIERYTASGWRTVARVRTRADGSFATRVPVGRGRTAYRLVAERAAAPAVHVAGVHLGS